MDDLPADQKKKQKDFDALPSLKFAPAVRQIRLSLLYSLLVPSTNFRSSFYSTQAFKEIPRLRSKKIANRELLSKVMMLMPSVNRTEVAGEEVTGDVELHDDQLYELTQSVPPQVSSPFSVMSPFSDF
jgi:hypothetical protein